MSVLFLVVIEMKTQMGCITKQLELSRWRIIRVKSINNRICIYLTSLLLLGCDTKSIFKWVQLVLLLIDRLSCQSKRAQSAQLFTHSWERIDRLRIFSRILAHREVQADLSRIWIWHIKSISYSYNDDNDNITYVLIIRFVHASNFLKLENVHIYIYIYMHKW